jgi:hypothetical protein
VNGGIQGRLPLSVDAIVVTYDSQALIEPCLSAVRESPHIRRLVIVDNASRDGSVTAARGAGAHVVVENDHNRGFAGAVNQGLTECDSEFVLLLNPDALLDDESLATLLGVLEDDQTVAMVGPRLVGASGAVLYGGRRFSTAANRLLWHVPLPWRPRWTTPEYEPAGRLESGEAPLEEVDYLWGAALLIRRRFLEEIGGLDERFFIYSEDEDLGRQAHERGLRCVVATAALARHVGGASSPDAAWAQSRIEASNARLLAKWEGERPAKLFAAGIGPVLALRALILALSGRGDQARLAWRTCRLLGRARRLASTARHS